MQTGILVVCKQAERRISIPLSYYCFLEFLDSLIFSFL